MEASVRTVPEVRTDQDVAKSIDRQEVRRTDLHLLILPAPDQPKQKQTRHEPPAMPSATRTLSYASQADSRGDDLSSTDSLMANLRSLQDAWRAKHETCWSKENLGELDVDGIDWLSCEPPDFLDTGQDGLPIGLISRSIANVKARAGAEDGLKGGNGMSRVVSNVSEAGEKSEEAPSPSSTPYLAAVVPPQQPVEPDITPMNSINSGETVDFDAICPSATGKSGFASPLGSGSGGGVGHKQSAFLRRLFKAPSTGEGSASGGVREGIFRKLQSRLVTANVAKGSSQDTELSNPVSEVECVSCLDDVPVESAVRVICHSYCKECFVLLISAAVQNEAQWPPKCCLNQIPFRLIIRYIPSELRKTLQQRSQEWTLPVSERVYCSQPACALWIRPKNIDSHKHHGFCENGHWTCTMCRGPSHGHTDCPRDTNQNLTERLAAEEGWKRCLNCGAFVEHEAACQHMTCRCGFEFCYVCGLVWGTCGCTMTQLMAIKDAAQDRRAQRRLREESDADDLRAALAQIAEFEREEALQAEAARLEEEKRLDEERRVREFEDQICQEVSRRLQVASRFEDFISSLNELHQLQQVMLRSQRDEETKNLLTEAASAEADLARRHAAQRQDLDAQHSQELALRRSNFDKEYSIRVAMEDKLERDFLSELQEYWGGAQDEIERCMLPLMAKMDRGHRRWQRWKDEQVVAHEGRLRAETSAMEVTMSSETESAQRVRREKETELQRRLAAQEKWFHEVVVERERLLYQQEEEEMEFGADVLVGVAL